MKPPRTQGTKHERLQHTKRSAQKVKTQAGTAPRLAGEAMPDDSGPSGRHSPEERSGLDERLQKPAK